MNPLRLERMLCQRVDDQAFIRLVRKWLKAGILEEAGQVIHPATGTPQGGIISPVLANIYLHYVLDLWMEKVVPKQLRGAHVYMRYADDFVVGFEYGGDAERFFEELPKRLAKFGLSMAMEKSGILRFSRCDVKGSKCFTFLGFEFYWARTRRGKVTVKRRTSKKKFKASLSGLKEWVRNNRSRPLKELAVTLRRKFTGYFNYYGVIGNTTLNQHEKRISGWCILTRKIVVHFNPQNDKEITSLVADRNGSPFESTYFYAKQTAIQEISILFLAFGLALVIAHVLMDRFSPLKKRSQNQTR